MYVCFEHDQAHLTQRLLCLESAELGQGEDALTMAKLAKLTAAAGGSNGASVGLIGLLRRDPKYAAVVQALERYAERLYLVKASGRHSTLDRIADAAVTLARKSPASLLVVDYLQKIPVDSAALEAGDRGHHLLSAGTEGPGAGDGAAHHGHCGAGSRGAAAQAHAAGGPARQFGAAVRGGRGADLQQQV